MIHRLNSCILIPAYNEEKKVREVIQKVRERGFKAVVVDDGSTDGTTQAVRDSGAYVLTHAANRGKGYAIRTGFEWVIQNGFEAVIIMDADGQHHPNEIEDFLSVLTPVEADIVVGNRMNSPQQMPFIRRWTNLLMSAIVSAVAGQNIPDSQCGYRALTREALGTLDLKTDRFEIESEMLMQAGRKGLKIKSIPITCLYLDERSHIRPLQDTLRFFKFLIQFIFSSN